MPKTLPIYIMAGEHDPVNNAPAPASGSCTTRSRRPASAELTLRVYPGARHELLNETNRDEVTRDLIDWLDAATCAQSYGPGRVARSNAGPHQLARSCKLPGSALRRTISSETRSS